MSDSSDEGKNSVHVPYSSRPEWKDVQPLDQDDGEEPVVVIDYSPEFKDVYGYFRAILKSGEKSERALTLTADAANINPANYTVWQYRRDILKALDKDLNEELDYMWGVIMDNTKNYQVWHHRRLIADRLRDGSKEKQLTEAVLNSDAKNYHAWQHRQWVIKSFNLFDGELEYTEQLIDDDARNNSAWNQRYFVINNTTGFTQEVLEREYSFVLNSIEQLFQNESAWNYLRGLLLHDKVGLCKNKKVSEFVEEYYNAGNRCPYLLALIVDMCQDQITQETKGDSLYTLERAKQLCDELSKKYDQTREKYWNYIKDVIEKKAQGEDVDTSCEPSSSDANY